MKNWKRLVSLLILLACIILSIFQCNRQIKRYHEENLVDNLRSVTKQSAITIENEISYERTCLEGMASEVGLLVDNGADMDEILTLLSSLSFNSNFKRLGFVDTDGIAQTTDGYTRNLSFREFYQKSMKGAFFLTDTITDSIGVHENINVFSTPVFSKEKTICGVLFATYRSDDFRQLFGMEGFDQTGSNCIVNSASNVVAATENLPFDASEMSLLEYLDSLDGDAKELMEIYYASLNDAASQDNYYQKINKIGGSYIYYEAIEMGKQDSPWYLVTMVSETTVDQEVSSTMGTITIMLLEIGLLVFLAFFLFLLDSDRTDRRQRKELERIAFVDPLTGGDNYARFINRVSKQDKVGYIVSMDLHAFKMINSVCGTERGDEVIVSVYRWTRECVSPDDIVAHANADRFNLFFPRLEKDDVIEKLTRINKKITHETKKMGIPQVVAYFGVATYEREESVELALSQANFARDSIHDRKNEFYSFFDQTTTDHIMNDKQMEDSFDEAMANGEFEVWYQPKIEPDNNSIVGAEALVRWRKPDGTLVSPGNFIPLFESNGMIRMLDEYVFRETCREQKLLIEKGFSVVPISVNLSRASIYSANLVERYKKITDEVGVDPNLVPIEITESAAVDENYMQKIADRFYMMGFPLQMDDFGSGYSSLASLNRMHFDALKLDKSLVDYIGNLGGDLLIKHTIALAKDLGMHVTAEGVEDEKQVEFLLEQNCDSIQGFFFSRPLPKALFEEMLTSRTTAA